MTYNNIAKIFERKVLSGCRKGILFCFLLISFALSAQTETVIVGQVLDKHDKTPLSLVNVYFKGTTTGTTTNDEGYFLIRSREAERRLVFSSIGYKTKEMRVKPGETLFVNVELEEQNTVLGDFFVFPGVNPALEWMKKIRLQRRENDMTAHPGYEAESVEQNLILLSRLEGARMNKRLFEQLQKGALSEKDSSLVVPLYMAESSYSLTGKGKTEISKNIFSTPEETDNFVMQLSKGINPELNFYNNAVSIFGKSMISPLAGIGNSYYDYYLADSLVSESGKQYEIHFRTKNPKNLAFNGSFRFDSASLSLTYIEADLPRKANINYVRNLSVKQEFEALPNNRWARKKVGLTMNLRYDVIEDSVRKKPELFISQSSLISVSRSAESLFPDHFAQSDYTAETLESRMQTLDDTPLMRTAKWVADALLTGYARAGWIDVGRLQQILRLTDVEGVRLALPLRTNERLWKNVSVGGYAGYGFRNRELKFSAFGQFRLPTEKRQVFELRYTDDYHRIDYNYNSYIRRENPWDTGDDDAVNTVLSFISGNKTSPRREWSLSYAKEWTRDIESAIYWRANKIFSNHFMPLHVGEMQINSFRQQSLTFVTRFSFGEKKYEDHLQRIYIQNEKPVIYATLEAGRYQIAGGGTDYYAKLIGSMKQHVGFAVGEWNYAIEAGWLFGRLPYPLLEISSGNEPSGIAFYQFNRMKYMEFGHDKYIRFNNEILFNGILFNYIPLLKHLNLRELVAVKAVVGGLSDRHRGVLDFPSLPNYLQPMRNPYIEASVGIANLLRVFKFQFNYRFTNNYEGVTPGRFSFSFYFGF